MRRAVWAAVVVSLLACGVVRADQKALDFQQAAEEAAAPAASARLQPALDEYQAASLRHRAAVFAWQLTSTKVIFWMVVGLVVAGVAFSAIQFAVALRRRSDFNDAEIALSMEGIKVRSQFLGILTLALSLGFFFLYLKTVYPIEEVAAASQSAPAKP